MSLEPGSLLAGKYQVEGEIGKGAYGRVYRARDTSLGRDVAIKELRKGGEVGSTDYADYVRRFEREAQVQARFNHPNIVHVYELVKPETEGDAYYLVMEYVDGKSLKEVLERGGPLPPDKALRIFRDILSGLEAVHAGSSDVVHRDIKPSNILRTKSGQAKLADFGLAQVGDESMRSGAGQPHPGTPAYMSPEQETTQAYLYPASDIFSAGCVLFEMLTGQGYKSALSRGQSLADLRPDLPAWVGKALEQALARDQNLRPASAKALWAILEQGKSDELAAAQEAARREAEAERQREAQEREHLQAEERAAREKAHKAKTARMIKTGGWIVGALMGLGLLAAGLVGLGILINSWVNKPAPSQFVAANPTAPVTATAEAPPAALSPTPQPTSIPTPDSTSTPLPAPITDAWGVEMAFIPAGSFMMGSDTGASDEKPVHAVSLSAFYMDVDEVTTAQYAAFLNEMGNQREGAIAWLDVAYGNPHVHQSGENWNADAGYSDHPVVEVTWYGSQAYCAWRDARLPTEAEWEYAARGGLEGKNYPWGDEPPVCTPGAINGAQFDDCSEGSVAVGTFSPNGYGLYDMAGNVREWVSDRYGDYPSGMVTDPGGPISGHFRVHRGGSWYLPNSLRVAARGENGPENSLFYLGFRCARSP